MIADLDEHYEVRTYRFEHRGGMYTTVDVRAGRPRTVHVVPPAGEAYAYDREDWPVDVQVHVSPNGRSVQVHVNGKLVH